MREIAPMIIYHYNRPQVNIDIDRKQKNYQMMTFHTFKRLNIKSKKTTLRQEKKQVDERVGIGEKRNRFK